MLCSPSTRRLWKGILSLLWGHMNHPLEAALQLELSYGHTVLDKPAAQRAWQKGYRYDQRSIDVALANCDLVRVNGGLTSPKAAQPEAILGRWLALRRAAETGGHLGRVSPPNVPLNAGQVAAWGLLTGARTAALTGLPGTGKTYLLAKLVQAAIDANYRVRALAPTGKAASVLSLKLDRFPVETIHRALGLRPGEVYNDATIEADLVVVDETSMVDAQLMAYLVSAIQPTTVVWFVGDPNQLPPVSAGWPFRDMVEHQLLPIAQLTQPQRQTQGNGILEMSYAAVGGTLYLPERNITHLNVPSKEVEQRAVQLYHQELSQRHPDLDVIRQAMLLSPVKDKKFEAATSNLNEQLSHLRFPQRTLGRSKFTVGDRILFTVNNYSYGFVNGELGILKSFNKGEADIENDVGFTYHLSGYRLSEWADWAYALTVHKAQGSEADVVVLMLHADADFMYTKNLVYTAMTRAKQHLYLVGDVALLRKALSKPERRRTCLPYLDLATCERIIERVKPMSLASLGDFL